MVSTQSFNSFRYRIFTCMQLIQYVLVYYGYEVPGDSKLSNILTDMWHLRIERNDKGPLTNVGIVVAIRLILSL